MVASKSTNMGRNAFVTISLFSAGALGKVVGPAAHQEGLPSKWGVDIWEGAELESLTFVSHLSPHVYADVDCSVRILEFSTATVSVPFQASCLTRPYLAYPYRCNRS